MQPRAGASVYVSPGVFAVGEEPVPPAPPEPDDAEEAEPPAPVVVFEVGDVVGPLGGMLRRKKRYMAQHYGASETELEPGAGNAGMAKDEQISSSNATIGIVTNEVINDIYCND